MATGLQNLVSLSLGAFLGLFYKLDGLSKLSSLAGSLFFQQPLGRAGTPGWMPSVAHIPSYARKLPEWYFRTASWTAVSKAKSDACWSFDIDQPTDRKFSAAFCVLPPWHHASNRGSESDLYTGSSASASGLQDRTC